MLGRSSAGFVLSFGMLALLAGCRDRGSADQDSRPLPTPEPPASATPVAPRPEPTSAAKKPTTDENKPRPVVTTTPTPVPPVLVPPADTATGGSPTTGTGGVPAAVPSVPPIVAPSAACLSRCQGALQGCLAQPVDGGVPGFANLDICKKAFEACQAVCK